MNPNIGYRKNVTKIQNETRNDNVSIPRKTSEPL